MKLFTLILTLAITISMVNATELKSDAWRTKLESVIHQYDTTGNVIVENGTYVYRYHTLVYKFHPVTTQIGDTTGETYNQEGPKEDGIFLQVSVREGVYQDQVKIPQEVKVPFWKTFFNAYPISSDKYLILSLSYGKTSNMKFVEALKTCFSTPKPRFGLYLVTKDAKELDKIELAKSPLITEDDIADYNWTNHTIYLTDTAAKRIPKVGNGEGKSFVIVVDGKRAYRGAFWSSISSISHPYPIIDVFPQVPRTAFKIERRYPDWPTKGELDPRDNEAIKNVFHELGKLTEK